MSHRRNARLRHGLGSQAPYPKVGDTVLVDGCYKGCVILQERCPDGVWKFTVKGKTKTFWVSSIHLSPDLLIYE